MRRLTWTIGALGAALLFAAPLSLATGTDSRTEASAVAVQVSVPGAHTSSTGGSGVGSYTYRDLVSIDGYTASSAAGASTASARSTLSAVSLLDGLVTASSVSVASSAEGSASAHGAFDVSVSGLAVNGAAVPTSPNARFELPDGLGYGVVDEQVVTSSPGAATYRGYAVGLLVHLDVGWHDLPAGTEVRLGYADTGAAAAPTPTTTTTTTSPPPGKPTPGPAPAPHPARGGGAGAAPKPRGGDATPIALPPTTPVPTPPVTPAPVPGALPVELPDSAGPPGDTEGPPPGGFSLTPPVDPAVRAQLLSGGYVFPVLGGARFTNDFGAARSDTGFHQGIDLFAPLGTPVVAVHDGTLLAVGWNRLGGHRLWLRDTFGNLYYYAHLSAYAAGRQDGDHVRAGEILGFVGNSGDAQGTPFHLHFEMHPQGRWAVPPFEYVSAWESHSATFSNPIFGQSTAPAASAPQQGGLVALGAQDISSASGLDPDSVAAAASTSPTGLTEGDGAVVGGAPAPTPLTVLTAPTPVAPGG